MKIKIIKSGPWQIGENQVEFVEGQTLEVGADVPDKIAEDMLRCDYAIPDQIPKIETKDLLEEKKAEADLENKEAEDLAAEQAEKEALEAKDEAEKEDTESKEAEADIESMDKDALELYARENLKIELDKRKSIRNLLATVKTAIEEKNNE